MHFHKQSTVFHEFHLADNPQQKATALKLVGPVWMGSAPGRLGFKSVTLF
jgi:hypothetical protein